MQEDPISLFNEWLHEAEEKELRDPNAMTLATTNGQGRVSSRMVLLKDVLEEEFVFYTNLGSPKAQQIKSNPLVALCFHWKSTEKQVRIEGKARQIPDATADSYFSQRDRQSQLGAWASQQSQPLESREAFLAKIQDYDERFTNQSIPRPPHWSGFAVSPEIIEFWEQKPFRLHERCVYTRDETGNWKVEDLYP